MNHANLTRRHVLSGATGAAVVAVAGCLGGEEEDDPLDGPPAQIEAYVVAYHWGYAVFDEDGQERDLIEIPPNTELTIHAVNDHAKEAVDALPDSVVAELEHFDGLARLNAKVEAGELREPSGDRTVEEVYEEAHGHGNEDGGHDEEDDHGHGDGEHENDGHGHEGDDHGPERGTVDHGFRLRDIELELPADAHAPSTGSTVFEEPGTYQAYCTVPCGEYHTQQRENLVHVTAG